MDQPAKKEQRQAADEFVPISESFPEQIIAKHKTPSESALYKSRLLVLEGRTRDLQAARTLLLPFAEVQSPVQKEIQASITDLENALLGTGDADSTSHEESLLLKDILDATLGIFTKSRCLFSWRKLATRLGQLGCQEESDYIQNCVVYCITLRDRPCHAASGLLRGAVDEFRGMPGLGELAGSDSLRGPSKNLETVFEKSRTATPDFATVNSAWLKSYLEALKVASQKARTNADKIRKAAEEQREASGSPTSPPVNKQKDVPDRLTAESQALAAEVKAGDGTQHLDVFETLYNDFLSPGVMEVFAGRKFLPKEPSAD